MGLVGATGSGDSLASGVVSGLGLVCFFEILTVKKRNIVEGIGGGGQWRREEDMGRRVGLGCEGP